MESKVELFALIRRDARVGGLSFRVVAARPGSIDRFAPL